MRDDAGAIIRWIGTCTDIHEQRLARDALERSERTLREADRRKDEFLAMLAHELRNPLAPVRNGLQILRLAGTDPRVVAQTGDMIDRQVQQLSRLVDDLMDVSRITRGKIKLQRTPIDVSTTRAVRLSLTAFL